MKFQFKLFLLLFLIKLTVFNICYSQSDIEKMPPRIKADFLGVISISDTIIQISDYLYVKENRDWQRFTTIIVSNRVLPRTEILKTNSISVLDSDIYVIDFLFCRKLILEVLKADSQIQEHIFRQIYDNPIFTPEPDNKDIIERWERRRRTALMRYSLHDLKLAVFEVDCKALNPYLRYSRDIVCASSTVKIGFPISDDFIE